MVYYSRLLHINNIYLMIIYVTYAHTYINETGINTNNSNSILQKHKIKVIAL